MSARLEKLRRLLAEKELDALLVSQAENRRYLSGFHGTAGYLLVTADASLLATDPRYTEKAQREAPDFEVIEIRGEVQKWLPGLVERLAARRLGFEDDGVTYAGYAQVRDALTTVPEASRPQLVPTSGLVGGLRAIKDAEEIALIQEAIDLSDLAFNEVAPALRPGMTEKQAAWTFERFLREHGSEELSFELLVASGPNTAMPHAEAGDRPIQAGEPVQVDMAACVHGYTSDLSRAFVVGHEPDETFQRVYDIVLGAQLTAAATIAAGMSGHEADRLARTVIEQAGYGDNFGHGLGHGIGLAIHEQPRLGPNSTDMLTDGMVFTLEPGIYISGWGGVRIEDVGLMENGRVRVLSRAIKTERF